MKKIIIIILGLVVLGLGWYLISPLFVNQVVDEQNPLQAQSDSVVLPSDIIIGQDVVMDEPMMDMPESFSMKNAVFRSADRFHKGSGDVLIVFDSEQTFLRFENFTVTNGPDLYVTLNTEMNGQGEHLILERLKGNIGSQNYDISGIDLSEYESVTIYCKAFSTLFASANL